MDIVKDNFSVYQESSESMFASLKDLLLKVMDENCVFKNSEKSLQNVQLGFNNMSVTNIFTIGNKQSNAFAARNDQVDGVKKDQGDNNRRSSEFGVPQGKRTKKDGLAKSLTKNMHVAKGGARPKSSGPPGGNYEREDSEDNSDLPKKKHEDYTTIKSTLLEIFKNEKIRNDKRRQKKGSEQPYITTVFYHQKIKKHRWNKIQMKGQMIPKNSSAIV